MILIYFIILSAVITLTIALRKYHIEYKTLLKKKEHPLHFLYGLCFFMTDAYTKLYTRIKPNGDKPFNSLKNKLHMLYPGKNVSGLLYVTLARRLATSIAVLIFFMAAGAIYSVCMLLSGDNSVTTLSRPENGEDSVY